MKSFANKFVPRTIHQGKYYDLLRTMSPPIVIASGSAGTGKTAMATAVGIEKLYKKEDDKMVITRPAVSAFEDLGFLPGSLNKKFEPWVRPIFDVMQSYYTQRDIEKLISDRVLELSPLAYMRGRTFDKSFILCDECQNCTPDQLLMLLTRIGEGSKMVLTGDITQHDLPDNINGLSDLLDRIEHNIIDDDIATIELGDDSIQRHPVIRKVISLYRG